MLKKACYTRTPEVQQVRADFRGLESDQQH
jgi:hypothetical protein